MGIQPHAGDGLSGGCGQPTNQGLTTRSCWIGERTPAGGGVPALDRGNPTGARWTDSATRRAELGSVKRRCGLRRIVGPSRPVALRNPRPRTTAQSPRPVVQLAPPPPSPPRCSPLRPPPAALMLPAGFTASAPLSGHVVSPASSPQTVPSRSGRLRGLSYLRHYTANHHHHSSHASPPAAATVVTAQAVPAVPPAVPSPLPDSTSPLTRRATSPLNNTGTAWIPTVSGVSGLSRVASSPAAELSTSSVHATSVSPGTTHRTVRSIDETILSSDRAARSSAPAHSPSSAALMAQTSDQPAASIRFTPFIDTRATRESLHFSPIERVLRYPEERIRVGRYSVRDEQNPSAPVGFKSKVVSRRHCEFWCESGQWFVRDVKSSSGTFLNHIRLSGAGMESSRYALNDGDILQLGMDFKGGEEQIFRCVRIRVELNRAWQKGLNNFKYVFAAVLLRWVVLIAPAACPHTAGYEI